MWRWVSHWCIPTGNDWLRYLAIGCALAGAGDTAAQAAGDPARGRETAALWCSSCHQIGPNFPERPVAPSFMRLAGNPRYSARYISDWVTHPHVTMPHFRFSDAVLDDLVAYIHSLRSDGGAAASNLDAALSGAGPARQASGTGFYVSGEGHVLTAAHVISECRRVTVETPGQGSRTAKVMKADSRLDLALLKTDMRPHSYASFAGGDAPEVGDRVLTYGYPFAGTLASSGSLSVGYVAALAGVGDNRNQFQMSAELQFGSSGGPVLDAWGRTVGVAISRLVSMRTGHSSPHGVNFATSNAMTRLFLAENGLPPQIRPKGHPLSPTEIVRIARDFTARVTCLH